MFCAYRYRYQLSNYSAIGALVMLYRRHFNSLLLLSLLLVLSSILLE